MVQFPGPIDEFWSWTLSKKANQNHDERFAADNALEYPLKVERISENRDGDRYQEMRWRYENGEIVFDDAWKCPLQTWFMRTCTQIDLLETEDEKHAKKLLDKFMFLRMNPPVKRDWMRLLPSARSCSRPWKTLSGQPQFSDRERESRWRGEKKSWSREARRGWWEEGQQIWGGWDTVHPASGGTESQIGLFMISSYAPSRDYPASFAIYEDSGINIKMTRRKLDDDSSVDGSSRGAGRANDPLMLRWVVWYASNHWCHQPNLLI